MVQFLLKLLLKQRIIAVQHDFHWLLVAAKLLTAKVHSRWVRGWNFGKVQLVKFWKLGVGQFVFDSAILKSTAVLSWFDSAILSYFAFSQTRLVEVVTWQVGNAWPAELSAMSVTAQSDMHGRMLSWFQCCVKLFVASCLRCVKCVLNLKPKFKSYPNPLLWS